MPEPDCFLRYRIGYGTLQPCQAASELRCYAKFYVGKIPHIRIGGAPLQQSWFWFYSLTRRKTFVGGKCALPSAILLTSDELLRGFECADPNWWLHTSGTALVSQRSLD